MILPNGFGKNRTKSMKKGVNCGKGFEIFVWAGDRIWASTLNNGGVSHEEC